MTFYPKPTWLGREMTYTQWFVSAHGLWAQKPISLENILEVGNFWLTLFAAIVYTVLTFWAGSIYGPLFVGVEHCSYRGIRGIARERKFLDVVLPKSPSTLYSLDQAVAALAGAATLVVNSVMIIRRACLRNRKVCEVVASLEEPERD